MSWKWLIVPCAVLAAVACAPRHELSPDQEYDRALQKSREVVRQYGAIENAEADRYLSSMTSRLVAALVYAKPKNAQYNVTLLNTVEPVAFSPGSGFILISRGLAVSLATEDELAFVVAHEIAHQELGHTAIDSEGPFDESLEYEADKLAAGTLARAGYDSYQALPALRHAARNREDLRGINNASASLERRTAKLQEFLVRSPSWIHVGVPLPQREFLRFQETLRSRGDAPSTALRTKRRGPPS